MPQKAATALKNEYSRSVGVVNGETRYTNGERKINEMIYESGNTNGNMNGENGHGEINYQANEMSAGLKSMAIEKPIST